MWQHHVTFCKKCDEQPKRQSFRVKMHINHCVSPSDPAEACDASGLRVVRGRPAVPEQRSGERVVSPGAAASSPLPLNGHRVNPLKVHPSAAVTRQSEEVGVRGGEWEEKKGEGERKDKESQ